MSDQFRDSDDTSTIIPLVKDLEETLSLLPPDHKARGERLGLLGIYLVTRYNQVDGREEDVEHAIQCFLEALDFLPVDEVPSEGPSITHDHCMSVLVAAFIIRNQRDPSHPDLQRAVDYSLKLLELRPEGHAQRAESLRCCAQVLLERYSVLGVVADLDASVAYYRQALQLTPPDHGVSAKDTSMDS